MGKETGMMVMETIALTMGSEDVEEDADEAVEVGKIGVVGEEVEALVHGEIGIKKMAGVLSKKKTRMDSEIGMQLLEPRPENAINRAGKNVKEKGKVVGEIPTKFPKLVMIIMRMQLSQFRMIRLD